MKKASSTRWLARQRQDSYVRQAQARGYRSRAWFKLAEIAKKFHLFSKPGALIDLGAAPGGWSQFLSSQAPKAKDALLIACDLLPMKPLSGVRFIQGDFLSEETLDHLVQVLEGAPVACILSDMAPNRSGIKAIDDAQSITLLQSAWTLIQRVLSPGGTAVLKGFQSTSLETFVDSLRGRFQKIVRYKPEASRAESTETYLVALNYLVSYA